MAADHSLGRSQSHMLVIGSTSGGKSVLTQTHVIQTALGFKFIVVIDDGLSWMTTCHKLDPTSRPIIVRSNGNQTFNIFDTRRLPLSAEHLTNATALCHLLVGRSNDEDKDKLRAAVLADTISEVYDVAYRAWRNRNPEAHYNLCRETALLLKFQEANGIEGFLDAFLEARSTVAMRTRKHYWSLKTISTIKLRWLWIAIRQLNIWCAIWLSRPGLRKCSPPCSIYTMSFTPRLCRKEPIKSCALLSPAC